MTSRERGQWVTTRRDFIAALKREMPHVLWHVHTHRESTLMLESAMAAGMAVFDRYAEVTEPDGSPIQSDTARLLVGRVANEMARKQFGMRDRYDGRRVEWLDEPDGEASRLRRLDDAVSAARFKSWRDRPWGTPWEGHDEVVAAADAVTEIGRGRGGGRSLSWYTVTLRRDGRAAYVGDFRDERIGAHEAELEVRAFDDLARAVMFLGFETLDAMYATPTLDSATDRIWIALGGTHLEIQDYGGGGPRALHAIVSLIDQVDAALTWSAVEGSRCR